MNDNFTWKTNRELPNIENHTKRKLDVLKDYLDVYFDTVVPNPAIDELNITLVDGFSGGGAYQDGAEIRKGSPLVLLEAVNEARQRLNADRNKLLTINARFFFVDNEPDHVAALKQEIDDRENTDNGNDIITRTGTFVHHLPQILEEIKKTKGSGRSIFFLDQLGYKYVPMSAIRSIFTSLKKAEVILTFPIDSLLNYMQESWADKELYQQLGIDPQFIKYSKEHKDESMSRAVVQRMLMAQIHKKSGADFFTPFMLRSQISSRWIMLAHLSNHQTARDKMLSVHWQKQNRFTHAGDAGLYLLGYDPKLIENHDTLFNFTDMDRDDMKEDLANRLPRELHDLMSLGPLKVEAFLDKIGNRTAARNEDIFDVLAKIALENELEVHSLDGRKKRSGSLIKISDKLILPSQRTLFYLP